MLPTNWNVVILLIFMRGNAMILLADCNICKWENDPAWSGSTTWKSAFPLFLVGRDPILAQRISSAWKRPLYPRRLQHFRPVFPDLIRRRETRAQSQTSLWIRQHFCRKGSKSVRLFRVTSPPYSGSVFDRIVWLLNETEIMNSA